MNEILGNSVLWPAEQILNKLILADSHLQKKLQPFAETSLQINTTAPTLAIRLSFEETSIRLNAIDSEKFSLPVKATVSGKAQNLLRLLIDNPSEQALVSDEFSLTGDVQWVQDLFTALNTMDLDWQDVLSPIVGDIATHELDQAVSSTSEWAKDSRKRLHHSMDDYLKEEVKLFPHRDQLDNFADDLDALRLTVDRVQAKIERISQQLTRLEN